MDVSLRSGFAMGRTAGWALIANASHAFSQLALVLVLARWTSAENVGAYALALAVLTPVVLVARMQLRSVFVTDLDGRHPLAEYFALRTAASAAVLLFAAAIAAVWGGGPAAVWLLGLAALRAVEGSGDLVQADLQRRDQWRPLGVAAIARTILSYGLLCALTIAGASTGVAISAAVVGSFVVFTTFERPRAQELLFRASAWRNAADLRLLRRAAPLSLVATLVALLVQIPRYGVDLSLGAEPLGFFAALTHPFLAGSLLVQSAGQALLTRLTPRAKRLPAGYARTFAVLLAVALLLGLAGVTAATFAGATLLTVLYGEVYAAQAGILPAIAVSSAVMFIAMALGFALTALRVFVAQAWISAAACVACTTASAWLIPTAGLAGAAWAAAIGWTVAALLQTLALTSQLSAYRRVSCRDGQLSSAATIVR